MIKKINIKIVFIFISAFFLFVSCEKKPKEITLKINTPKPKQKKKIIYTNGFDFPVGKPDAKKYYNALRFGKNKDQV